MPTLQTLDHVGLRITWLDLVPTEALESGYCHGKTGNAVQGFHQGTGLEPLGVRVHLFHELYCRLEIEFQQL